MQPTAGSLTARTSRLRGREVNKSPAGMLQPPQFRELSARAAGAAESLSQGRPQALWVSVWKGPGLRMCTPGLDPALPLTALDAVHTT